MTTEPPVIDDWFLIWDSNNSWLQVGGVINVSKKLVEDITTGPIETVYGTHTFSTFNKTKYRLGENCDFDRWETPVKLQRYFANGFTKDWASIVKNLENVRITRGTPNRQTPKRAPAEVDSIMQSIKRDLKIKEKSTPNKIASRNRRKSVRRVKKNNEPVEIDTLTLIPTRKTSQAREPRPRKRKSTSGQDSNPVKRSKSVSESTLKKESKNKRSKSELRLPKPDISEKSEEKVEKRKNSNTRKTAKKHEKMPSKKDKSKTSKKLKENTPQEPPTKSKAAKSRSQKRKTRKNGEETNEIIIEGMFY